MRVSLCSVVSLSVIVCALGCAKAATVNKGDAREPTPASTARVVESENAIGDPELAESDGLRIRELVLARGVKVVDDKKVPVDPGKSFSINSGRVYAFLSVVNPKEEQTEITVSWAAPNGRGERGKVAVNVEAQETWNTRAFLRYLSLPGLWHVVVRDKDEKIIARAPFELTE